MADLTGLQGGVLGAALVALAFAFGRGSTPPTPPVAAADSVRPGQTLPPSTPPNLAMQDVALLDVTLSAAGDSTELRFFVSNKDTTPTMVRFSLAVSDSATGEQGSFKLSPDSTLIQRLGVQEVRLWLKAPRAPAAGVQKGFLTMVADANGAPTRTIQTRPIRIGRPPHPAPPPKAPVWLSVLFFGGLVIAFATVLCAWPWRGPATQYAPIQWNRDSWAANLALAGSALVAFTSLVAPTAVFHYMTRAEYGSLAALLTGAVALATAGYAFLGVARLVLGVLLTVTLGAAVSQLLTLGLLVAEARRLLVLRIEVYLAIQVLVVSTVVALVVYGYRTILDIGKATTRVAEERVMAERPLHLP